VAASALVYLSSLHPERERGAARGGPSGERCMADSLLTGLADLGFRVSKAGTLRHFLSLRMGQALRSRPPDVVFLDPWSLALARRYRALPRTPPLRTFVLEWFGTTAAAIPAGAGLRPSDYLVPYPYPHLSNRFIGFILRSETGSFLADGEELRRQYGENLERPRTFGVAWGKEPRYFGSRERALIKQLATRLPMHLTVEWGDADPLTGAGIVNHGHMDPRGWRALLGGARFVLGLGDPILGPTALEALASGAVLLNPSFAPARTVDGNPGVRFDTQHSFAATIGVPHVVSIDPARTEQTVRTVEELMFSDPETTGTSLPHGLADFTRSAYVSRLAQILG